MHFVLAELLGLAAGIGSEWMARFGGRAFPDKTITAGQCAKTLPNEVMEAQGRVDLILIRMVHAIAHHDFPNARLCSEQERKEREQLRVLKEKYRID